MLIEAPMVTQEGFCATMLKLTAPLLNYVKHIAIMVQPTIRRVVQKTDWITAWNNTETAPFKFYRMCSCAFPSTASQLTHITYYIGATMDLPQSVCIHVPMTGQTREHAGHTLNAICTSLLTMMKCGQCGLSGSDVNISSSTSASSSASRAFTSRLSYTRQPLRAAAPVGHRAKTRLNDQLQEERNDSENSRQDERSAQRASSQRIATHAHIGSIAGSGEMGVPEAASGGFLESGEMGVPEATLPETSHPTLAKVLERQGRNAAKAAGHEYKPKKKVKFIEDHQDDCGDCLDSLDHVMGCVEAIYDEFAHDLNQHYDDYLAQAFPIDASTVARAQTEPNPHPQFAKDPRAPDSYADCLCPGCRGQRGRDDCVHNRIIGQCYYPYTEPFIPKCEACIRRITIGQERSGIRHNWIDGECKFANRFPRASAGRPSRTPAAVPKAAPAVRQTPPHEVRPQARAEPTAHQPTRLIDGSELGSRAENELAREEERRAEQARAEDAQAAEGRARRAEKAADAGDSGDALIIIQCRWETTSILVLSDALRQLIALRKLETISKQRMPTFG